MTDEELIEMYELDYYLHNVDNALILLRKEYCLGKGCSRMTFTVTGNKDLIFKLQMTVGDWDNQMELLGSRYFWPLLPIAPCWEGELHGIKGIFQQRTKPLVDIQHRRGSGTIADWMQELGEPCMESWERFKTSDGFQAGRDPLGNVLLFDYATDVRSWMRTFGLNDGDPDQNFILRANDEGYDLPG